MHCLVNMQRLWTCLFLAITVRGKLASAGNGEGKEYGYINDDPSPAFKMRVVGGQTTTNAELGGYIVAMLYFNQFVCGGTLIHDRIVLSAAHCFIDRTMKDEWDFIGGISNLNEPGELRKVKDFVIPPDFRSEDLHSDVAIVLLNEPLVGENIGQLSLCATKLKEGMPLVVSGWGLTNENAKLDIYLRSATVPYIEWNKCSDNYHGSDVELTNTMLCAGVLGDKDACLYDSGGPLVYKKEICGIVSFGIGCADRKYPGVYTDVMSVKPFIEKSIEQLLSVK